MTIYGWDLSHYDWDRGLTAAELRAAPGLGIAFWTHKIGEGRSYVDPRFDDWWRIVRGLAPLPGAYFVQHPGDAAGQADRFLALLDARAPGWRSRPFLLQLDAERFPGMDRAPNLAEIRAFVGRLRAAAPQHRPIVYAPKWLYGNGLAGLDAPLWASNYGANPATAFRAAYPGDRSSRWAAYSGQTPAILQYGSKTRIGAQGTCDANAYRGGIAQLRALVHPEGDNDMELSDTVKLRVGGEVPYAVKTTTVEGVLTSTNYYVLQTRNKMLAELAAVRAGQAAILAATAGPGIDVVLARIDQHAADEAARYAELLDAFDDVRDLVEQVGSGALAAADVVRLIGERLAAAATLSAAAAPAALPAGPMVIDPPS